ncbi:MAG: hypothetical protein COB58_05135 [Thalassobium sp.]|jgi:hypothetical protein|nr:MAG: hypothetical protein COB58_05135 [Thalassobium sp.]
MLALDPLDIIRRAPRDLGLEFDDIMEFSRRSTKMKAWWPDIETTFVANEDIESPEIPDITIWPAGAALVLTPKAYRLLGDLLGKFGELLPVRILNEEQPCWIFNCLTKKDADPELSEWEYQGGMPISIKRLGFEFGDNDPVVFKSDFDNCAFLYCGDRFRKIVAEYELKGLAFDSLVV